MLAGTDIEGVLQRASLHDHDFRTSPRQIDFWCTPALRARARPPRHYGPCLVLSSDRARLRSGCRVRTLRAAACIRVMRVCARAGAVWRAQGLVYDSYKPYDVTERESVVYALRTGSSRCARHAGRGRRHVVVADGVAWVFRCSNSAKAREPAVDAVMALAAKGAAELKLADASADIQARLKSST